MPRFAHWRKAIQNGSDTYTSAQSNADRRGVLIDFRNNVVLNWGDLSAGISEPGDTESFLRYQLLENFYKEGGASDDDLAHKEASAYHVWSFLDGNNRMNGSKWSPAWAKDKLSDNAYRIFSIEEFYVEKVDTDTVWVTGDNYKEDVLIYAGVRYKDAVDERCLAD